MTRDESNAKISENMAGRTIDCVMRKGPQLVFMTTCGREVVLQADVTGEIHFVSARTVVMVPGLAQIMATARR